VVVRQARLGWENPGRPGGMQAHSRIRGVRDLLSNQLVHPFGFLVSAAGSVVDSRDDERHGWESWIGGLWGSVVVV
jgi:hypothetical protein